MSSKVKLDKKNHVFIDMAWDKFSEFIGEHNLRTPLSISQFEEIFNLINRNDEFTLLKGEILYSFRHESYAWPLVKREENTLK